MPAQEGDSSQRTISKDREDREPIVLDRARLILQNVVDIPESTLTKNSDLGMDGKYKSADVREALTMVAIVLLATHPHKDKWANSSTIRKQSSDGRVKLNFGIIYGEDRSKGRGHVGQPEALKMSLTDGDKYILESVVLLEDRSALDIIKEAERFADWREGKDCVFVQDALRYAGKGKMDEFRKIRRGLRWTAYNMLNWDNDFKLPEDVGRSPSPSKV